jgi:streptomycin 6-kinase
MMIALVAPEPSRRKLKMERLHKEFGLWNTDFHARYLARVAAAKKRLSPMDLNLGFVAKYMEVVTDLQATLVDQLIAFNGLLAAWLNDEPSAPHEEKIRNAMQIAESHLAVLERLIGWKGKDN